MSSITALGHWDIFLDQRKGCLLLALQHQFQQHMVSHLGTDQDHIWMHGKCKLVVPYVINDCSSCSQIFIITKQKHCLSVEIKLWEKEYIFQGTIGLTRHSWLYGDLKHAEHTLPISNRTLSLLILTEWCHYFVKCWQKPYVQYEYEGLLVLMADISS